MKIVTVLIEIPGSSDLAFLGSYSTLEMAHGAVAEHVFDEFEYQVDPSKYSFSGWCEKNNVFFHYIENEVDITRNWWN